MFDIILGNTKIFKWGNSEYLKNGYNFTNVQLKKCLKVEDDLIYFLKERRHVHT